MNFEKILNECKFQFVRSSGKGGQHVNKVSSKVELYFDVVASQAITDSEKELLLRRLENKIDGRGCLQMDCQTGRSQLENRELVKTKLRKVLEKALRKEKPRVPTQPTHSSKEKRITEKKIISKKKKFRQTNNINPENQ